MIRIAHNHPERRLVLICLAVVLLCSCHFDEQPSGIEGTGLKGTPPPPPTYSVGGTITGLTGSGLVLANGNDSVSQPSGAKSFTFATAVASGTTYAVTVKTQPSGETCQVSGGSGTVGAANVASVQVSCVVNTYSVGGTITGLQGSGLVLANGNDTVSPASGATSFTFPTPVASGMTFAVTVESSPKGQACQVTNGTGTMSDAAVTNVVIACTRLWTWVSGANTTNAAGVYGTKGTAAPSNVPGARWIAVSWTDGSGNLWLFGGFGYTSAGSQGALNDLWTFTPGTGEWTWVSGANTINGAGVYGTKGTAAAGNMPGARGVASTWRDGSGNLWLFGGRGYDSAGTDGPLNDLWKFTPGTGEWTWVSGANTINAGGVYGTKGTAAAGNGPGARRNAVAWTDGSGNLWLFGGLNVFNGYAARLNDLWTFNPGTGEWTWVSGANTINAAGVYGTKGTAAPSDVPGARSGAVSWTDRSGNLWLFGGTGYDSSGTDGQLNDLWTFTPGTGEWTWVSGANTINGAGVYGTQGTAAAGNVPGARGPTATWTDGSGSLWLFGGTGYDSAGTVGPLNDLWKFTPGTGEWTWVSGANTVNAAGVYGTKGTAAVGNVPGARSGAVSWADGSGNLWLFGGGGSGIYLNDLWVYGGVFTNNCDGCWDY
jgi:N-acetylneuraminic acid mutarotase